MPPKYIAFIVFIWVGASILALLMEEQVLGAGEVSTLQQLTGFQQVTTEEAWGFWSIVAAAPTYLGAIWSAITLEPANAFLTGNLVYVKWLILGPVVAMFIWGLVLTFMGIFQKVLS